jgi:hypothetical protein
MENNSLPQRFEQLKRERNALKKGREFEHIIQQLLEASRFRVRRNPRVSRPRQTDLFASHLREDFIVEAKWEAEPLDIGDIDDVRSRLSRTPGHIAALVFSMSGFTKPAISDVAMHKQRLILLFDRREIERALIGETGLLSLVQQKSRALVEESKVLFESGRSNRPTKPPPPPSAFGEASVLIWHPKLGSVPWISGGGGFGHCVFPEDIPDVDWTTAQGHGVGFDLQLEVDERGEIAKVLDTLRRVGWITPAGRFTIQQNEAFWFGIGARDFIQAIEARPARYADVKLSHVHHTEEATYFDLCETGFFTLSFDLDARNGRVWRAELSAQLPGIPLDPHPFLQITQELLLEERGYFRPLAQRPVYAAWHWMQKSFKVQPVAYLLGSLRDERVVKGIVGRSPFGKLLSYGRKLSELEKHLIPLREFDVLPFRLSSWHDMGDKVDYYYVRGFETAWTGGAFVCSLIADWNEILERNG